MAEHDTTINFGVANVSTLYSANSGVIDLATNHGLKLPSAIKSFYAVWWNYTDYPDPTDDPDREVVKVYKKINDKLFIQRGCQGTTPSDKNLIGKTYRIAQFFDEDQFNKSLFYFKNPSLGTYYFNDFEHASTITTASFDSFVRLGSNGSTVPVTAQLNKSGIYRINSGSTGTSQQGYGLANTSAFILNSADFEMAVWICFEDLNNENSKSYNFFSGFGDDIINSALTTPNSCIGFLYGNNTASIRGNTWRLWIRENDVNLLLENTGIPIKSNIWYELRVKVYQEGYCEFFINKTLIKKYNGSLPMSSLMTVVFGISQVSTPSGQGSFLIDAFEMKARFRNERTAKILNER